MKKVSKRFESPVFSTVKEANEALDSFMNRKGCANNGSHYTRPDGSRGPIVVYDFGMFELMFTLDRVQDGWKVSAVWPVRAYKYFPLKNLLWGFEQLQYIGQSAGCRR
jgi:hypothetical protein